MSKQTPGRMHWVMQKILIPTAAISSSAAILIWSYQYHERHLNEQLLNGQAAQALASQIKTGTTTSLQSSQTSSASQTSTATASDHSNTSNKQSSAIGNSKSTTHSDKLTTPKTTATKPSSFANHPGKSTGTQDNSAAATLGAVLGGQAKIVAKNAYADTSVKSSVLQFGPSPDTEGVLSSYSDGQGHSLTVPAPMTHDIVAVPLEQGVIWAQIPKSPTIVGAQNPPTVIQYTPFPTDASPTPLTEGAITIGQVPANVASASAFNTDWTTAVSPAQVTSGSAASDNASTSQQPDSATAMQPLGGSNSNASLQHDNVAQNKPNTTTVHLLELEQTHSGAVIVFELTDASGAKTDALQYFDDTTRHVLSLANLQTTARQNVWWAVGQTDVYWGTSVRSSNGNSISGSATQYNLTRNQTQSIALGTWTDNVYIHGDNLVYQIGNTSSWALFTPNP
ncbi:hypothetical protein [Alicyclobacillus suci]|uniref:hypothetical protein n=1 Tax=Alicyclobacillus suci TaxID=2816080 RepID=UPI001A8DA647|nr:hypothetical protein [Alicyclobacillus suci]